MEPTQSSETSAFNTQTPGKYPEDNLSLLQHGESLKTRTYTLHHLLKMEPTQSSETSAFNTQTPGKYPEDNLSRDTSFSYKALQPIKRRYSQLTVSDQRKSGVTQFWENW
jgi:hypothetical protein